MYIKHETSFNLLVLLLIYHILAELNLTDGGLHFVIQLVLILYIF